MQRRDFLATSAAAGLLATGARPAFAASAAQTAVEAAKQFSGTEITIVWEAGLQSLDPTNFSGPAWEKATGIKVKVVEVPAAEMFTKIMQEHRGGTGAYDALNVIPAWMPDLVQAGALELLDPFVDKYGYRDELQEIAPVYRDNQMKVGDKIYGFPDDGDVFLFYYRKDVWATREVQEAFKAKYGYDLRRRRRPGSTSTRSARFLTEVKAASPTGPRFFREPAYAQFMFQERFRIEGGKFFDAETMKATINSHIGVKVLTDWVDENNFMPAGGGELGLRREPGGLPQGDTAMTISWPPYGRWAAGYGADEQALSTGYRSPRSRARSATP